MKSIMTFILLLACLATQSQSWDWAWTQQLRGTDGIHCEAVATDNLNQSYLLVTYEDTLVIGDTIFRHPYQFNHMQSVIGIFDQFGHFKKAMDFYCPVSYQPFPTSVKPENSQSILVGGTYSDEYLASDTTLFTENSNVDAFIGKYDEQGKHKWLRTIKGPNQDYLIDFIPAGNGTSYVIGFHKSNNIPVWVNFFSVDSVQHKNTLIYVLKLDATGNIIWRRSCICKKTDLVNVENATLGADGNIYVQGYSSANLYIGQDTLRHGAGTEPEYFHYAYDIQGNLVHKQMKKSSLNLTNFYVDAEHNVVFGGFIYKTTCFANDTIVITQDRAPNILGKMDLQNNLLWYHLFDPVYNANYNWLDFSMQSDTIYATLTFQGGMTVGDSMYLSMGRQTVIIQYSTNGALYGANMLQGNNSNYTYRIIADNCSNLLIGGVFKGTAYNGTDTIQTSRDIEGYLASVKRWTHAIDIGPDTVINYNGTLRLSAGAGYDAYAWSTDESDSSIVITGSDLGAGPHKIWVSVYKNGCERRDTVVVTVKNNIGLTDWNDKSGLCKIYPNPVNDFAVIEYELPADALVQINFFDVTGRQIDLIVNQRQQAGTHRITHDTRNLEAGLYYYQIRIDDKTETKKMIII